MSKSNLLDAIYETSKFGVFNCKPLKTYRFNGIRNSYFTSNTDTAHHKKDERVTCRLDFEKSEPVEGCLVVLFRWERKTALIDHLKLDYKNNKILIGVYSFSPDEIFVIGVVYEYNYLGLVG